MIQTHRPPMDAIGEIFELSEQEPKCINRQFIKLIEETGELSVEIQVDSGECDPEKGGDDGILGECVDVAQCAISIFARAGGTRNDFIKLLSDKNYKWRGQIFK